MATDVDSAKRLKRFYVVDIVVPGFVFVVGGSIFGMERGFLLAVTALMVTVIMHEFWHLKSRIWFAAFMASVAVIHVSAVFIIDLPNKFDATALFIPIVVAEGVLLLFIVSAVEKRIQKKQ
ncbi:hypothetical protein [uncultured Brevundimonas sp.]|uniref:hypothetical protein n=1 Tax=uncultured Brevundimonas sp. TaxID=213418 RepID=UPI0030EEDE43|tara:strand:- start:2007 stop:2369 length:363 start_codon:yes stop_codon:yes gene_type:complete